jgi:hypothetical protein
VTKKEDTSIAVASMMARSWSDEALAAKSASDLVKAYGVTVKFAESLLKSERNLRGMS